MCSQRRSPKGHPEGVSAESPQLVAAHSSRLRSRARTQVLGRSNSGASRGAWAVLLLALVAAVTGVAPLGGGPFGGTAASAQSVAAKKAQAKKIADQIDSISSKIDVLDEDYLQAQEHLALIQKRLLRAQNDTDVGARRLAMLQDLIRKQGMQIFADPTGSSMNAIDGAQSISEVARKSIIATQGSQRIADAVDLFKAERLDYEHKTAVLSKAQNEAKSTSALLANQKAQAEALQTQLESYQKQVNGELAGLIAEQERERAAAEAKRVAALEKQAQARAKAELQARLAAQKASLSQLRNAAAAAAKNAAKNAKPGQTVSQAQAAARILTGGARLAHPLPAKLRNSISAGPLSAAIAANSDNNAVVTNPKDASTGSLQIDAGVVDVAGSPGASRAVSVAMAQIGKPYVWAASGPGSFDCSGLMLYAWRAAGRSLPHSSRDQYSTTRRVPVSSARPGDLVFFGHPIHHVGMYIGGGQMVEASHRGAPVRTHSIFRSDLVGVGRVSG